LGKNKIMSAISGAGNSPFANLNKASSKTAKLKIEGLNENAIKAAFGLDKNKPDTLLHAMTAICSDAGDNFSELPTHHTSAFDLISAIGREMHEAQKNYVFNDTHRQVAQNMYALLKVARKLFEGTHDVFSGFKRDQRGNYDDSTRAYLNEVRTNSTDKGDNKFNQTAWTSYFKDVLAFQETVVDPKKSDLDMLGKRVTPEESQKNLVYLGVRAKGQNVTREDVNTHWESTVDESEDDIIKTLKSTIQVVKEAFQPESASSGESSTPVGVDGSPRGSHYSSMDKSILSGRSASLAESASSEESSTPVDGSPRGSDSSSIATPSVSERSASTPEGAPSGESSTPVGVDESPKGSDSSSMDTSIVSERSAKRDDGTHGIKTFTQPDKITASTRLKEKGKCYVPRGESQTIRTSVRELYDAVDSGKARMKVAPRMKNEFENGFFYGLIHNAAVYCTSQSPELKEVSRKNMHLDSKEVYVDFKGLEGLIRENFIAPIPDKKDVVDHLMIVKRDGRLPDGFPLPGGRHRDEYYTFLEKAASYVTTIVTAPKLFDVVGDSKNPQLRVCDSLIPYHLIATPFPRFQGNTNPDHKYFIKSDGTIKEDKKDELQQRFQRVFDMMCWPAQQKGMDLSMPMPSDFFKSLSDGTKTEMREMIVVCIKELSQKYPGVRLYINPIGFSPELKKELAGLSNVVVHDKDITEPHRLRQDGEKEVLIATMPHPTHVVGNGAFSDDGQFATEENLSAPFPTYIEASKRGVNPYPHSTQKVSANSQIRRNKTTGRQKAYSRFYTEPYISK
jgi:hypothetical protein